MPGPPELAGPALGETVGPYRLEAVLGEGAMGIVYRAVREPEGTIVALKLLRRELSTDDTYRRRFAREGRIASGLEHRHLVPVLEAGEAGGRPYLVSDYVEGRTLANLLELDGPLPLSALLRVVAEIATGLDTLHREGLVHRDVKPSNIIVGSTGTTFLTDFGLAKGAAATVLTKPGRVVGTLEYLAPEVIRGSPAAHRTRIRRDDPRDPRERAVRPVRVAAGLSLRLLRGRAPGARQAAVRSTADSGRLRAHAADLSPRGLARPAARRATRRSDHLRSRAGGRRPRSAWPHPRGRVRPPLPPPRRR